MAAEQAQMLTELLASKQLDGVRPLAERLTQKSHRVPEFVRAVNRQLAPASPKQSFFILQALNCLIQQLQGEFRRKLLRALCDVDLLVGIDRLTVHSKGQPTIAKLVIEEVGRLIEFYQSEENQQPFHLFFVLVNKLKTQGLWESSYEPGPKREQLQMPDYDYCMETLSLVKEFIQVDEQWAKSTQFRELEEQMLRNFSACSRWLRECKSALLREKFETVVNVTEKAVQFIRERRGRAG